MEELRAYLAKDEVDKKAKVITKLNFQDETNVSAETNFIKFYIINAQTGAQAKPLTKGFYRFNNIDFTPDGKHLIISGYVDSLESPDRALENQILRADADGSNQKVLLGKKNMNYGNVAISPSGKQLAFQYSNTSNVEVPQLGIISLNAPANITTIPYDRGKANIIWANDEKHIYFSAQSNGGQPVYRANIATRNVEQLSDYNSGVLNFDISANKLVFARTEVSNPSEIFVSDASMKNIKQVSNFS
jgi:dipeptidyl aminopeptidase/acylaminoacyl peptidase